MPSWVLGRRSLLRDRVRLGRWGEKRAEKYLSSRRYHVLDRNFSCKMGEIDLIMVDPEGVLVFVEVKTRAKEDFSPAEASVTPGKRVRMARAARFFLSSNEIEERPCRFDVVTVVLPQRGAVKIEHFERTFVI